MWYLILASCTKYVRIFKNKYIIRVYNLYLQVNIDIDTADTKRLVENPYKPISRNCHVLFNYCIYAHIYITLSLYAFLPGSFIIIIISSRCALVKLRCQPTDCQPTATGIYAGVTILEVEVRGEAASKKLPSPKPFGIWFQTLKLKMGCCLVWVNCFRWFFFSGHFTCRWSSGEPAVNLLGCMPKSCYFFGCPTKNHLHLTFWSRKKGVGTAFSYWQNLGRCSNSPQL